MRCGPHSRKPRIASGASQSVHGMEGLVRALGEGTQELMLVIAGNAACGLAAPRIDHRVQCSAEIGLALGHWWSFWSSLGRMRAT